MQRLDTIEHWTGEAGDGPPDGGIVGRLIGDEFAAE